MVSSTSPPKCLNQLHNFCTVGKNIRKKRTHATKNITGGKYSVKCVGVKFRNAIGRDIWELESIEMILNMEVVEEIWVARVSFACCHICSC